MSRPRFALCLFALTTLLVAPRPAHAGFGSTGDLNWERTGHVATLLSDGRVLVTGGGRQGYPTVLDVAEIYDPATGTFSLVSAHMSAARRYHTATLLPNGKVLIAGGSQDGPVLDSAELFDPSDGTFTPTQTAMQSVRFNHTATLLPNGTVLLAGGAPIDGVTAEIYDPATDTFTATANPMALNRLMHTATLLANGKVLIAGGFNSNTAEIYDPPAQTFTLLATHMTSSRRSHTATALPNRQVLITGGYSGSSPTNSTEVYDIDLGTFTATMTMDCTRVDHSATLLTNGTVLIAGFGTAQIYQPATHTFTTNYPMSTVRQSHTATLLANGRVLIAGGHDHADVPFQDSEIFDPAFELWIPTMSNMTVGRRQHTATLLPDRNILIAGGADGSGIHNTAELYDPVTRTFSAIATSMTSERYGQTATLLGNGKVLLAGGAGNSIYWSTTELFDPAVPEFVATGSMTMFRIGHTATLLADGKVLITGGYSPYGYTNSAEIYDPALGTFTRTAHSMMTGRSYHTATLLPDGRVLIAGGQVIGGTTNSAELYDPATGSFASTTLPMFTARYQHTATLLPDGEVLIAGGQGGTYLNSAEMFHPSNGGFTQLANTMQVRRAIHSATLMATGQVLLCGGFSDAGYLDTCERYDPAQNSFIAVAEAMSAPRAWHTATMTRRGRVLITGGIAGLKGVGDSAELYDAGLAFESSRQPIVSSLTSPVCQPAHLGLSGSRFRSDSEGSSGRSNNSASDPPLLRLQRVDNEAVQFASPDSFSAFSFFSREMRHLASGRYRTAIVSNGIASIQEAVDIETTPIVGAYDAASVDLDASTVVPPSSLPAGYDGSFYSQAATAAGFEGTLRVNGSTGAVVVSNARPVGTFAVWIASSNACGSASTAFTLNVIGPPAAVSAFDGTPQTAAINSAFAVPLAAMVTDSAGHPLNNVAVTFTAPPTGASASFSGGGTAYTNTAGFTSIVATANGVFGAYQVVAAVGALTATFSLTNIPPVPTNTHAWATSNASVAVTWTAAAGATYEVQRLTQGDATTVGTATSGSLTDNTAAGNTSYLYRVRAIAPFSTGYGPADLATTVVFSIDPAISAQHIEKLRAAVDALCALAGVTAPSYSDDPPTAGVTLIRRAHMMELRGGVNAARNALKIVPIVYARPAITAGETTIAACDLEDIRRGVE